ncbi:MAG: lactate utilization protein [Halobacteriota archaeon]
MTTVIPYSASNMLSEVHVDAFRWNKRPSDDIVAQTVTALEENGITVLRVKNGQDALESLKSVIPSGAEVMDGASITLFEIGYRAYLDSGQSQWRSLRAEVHAEGNATKRHELRRKSMTAEYFVSGVNAITQSGELVACDTAGSRVGAWLFSARHLILVSGVNKIVPTLEDAFHRVREYVYPLESARAKKKYGEQSRLAKWAIIGYEEQKERVTLVLVDEALGY